jgi:hypothetical protein
MVLLADFASIVLNPANQIIHPARYWGIFKDWDGQPISEAKIPWLYRYLLACHFVSRTNKKN